MKIVFLQQKKSNSRSGTPAGMSTAASGGSGSKTYNSPYRPLKSEVKKKIENVSKKIKEKIENVGKKY